ncbi:bpX6 domain-containing protein [Chromobacterium subtsugae]|uniref:bpX6 domain-containing protein n=1 Tax=Chromobacterium subtsugae TaxID=251747 RepID=UPI000641683C|nr:bpX6 domain-containing protein [Chromobacterium subtsugae]OBU85906.1 hypothetical protein MY55_13910 [Chromobacterium subtsugae]
MTETAIGAQIRRPLLQGRHWIAGQWLPAGRFDEAARQRRILAGWHAGASAYRFPDGDLLRYAAPVEQLCEQLDGWPLQLLGRALCSAPLTEAEYQQLPPADLWLVTGGRAQALNLADAEALRPGDWLDASAYAVVDMYDCRHTLPRQVEQAPVTEQSLRQLLGGAVPPASPQQLQFLQALDHPRQEASAQPAPQSPWRKRLIVAAVLAACVGLGVLIAAGSDAPAPSYDAGSNAGSSSGGPSHFFPLLALAALAYRFRDRRAPPRQAAPAKPAGKPGKGGATAQALIPARRLAAQAMPQAWRDWLARAAMTSHLSRVLGRRQAAYMREMLAMFETGRINEALRHAIPLGGDGASTGQAFGTPNARRDLSLTPRHGSAGPSIQLGDELNQHLRQLYRRTFDKLDREGKIDQAVFVLAELLQAHAEALDYLERHERFSQAAELALAWDMPAALIVRLMCKAGDLPRALAVARRDHAFAHAIPQLESRWPEATRQLREEWAQSLVEQGRWLEAAQAIWPLASQRERAAQWLAQAEEAGGNLAAEALVQRALLLPDTLRRHESRILAIRDGENQAAERAAIAHALLAAGQHTPASRLLARAMFNHWLVDQDNREGRLSRRQLQTLLNISQDGLLQADLPGKLPAPLPNPLQNQKEVGWLRAPTLAGLAIMDAALLANGRLLVALGEAGAAIVDPRGKIAHRFPAPADSIVLADSGQVALAVIWRGDALRVHRLDLARREQQDLGAVALDCYADSFDGVGWAVGQDRQIRVLDVARGLHSVLWQVGDLPGRVARVMRSPNCEHYELAGDDGKMQLWQYSLPGRRLQSRGHIPVHESAKNATVIPSPWGSYRYCWLAADKNGHPWLGNHPPGQKESFLALPPDMAGGSLNVTLGRGWLAVAMSREAAVCTLLARAGADAPDIAFSWPAGSKVQLKMQNDSWLMFDRQGRIVTMDMERCSISMLTVS